jgi:hypothetical protein
VSALALIKRRQLAELPQRGLLVLVRGQHGRTDFLVRFEDLIVKVVLLNIDNQIVMLVGKSHENEKYIFQKCFCQKINLHKEGI